MSASIATAILRDRLGRRRRARRVPGHDADARRRSWPGAGRCRGRRVPTAPRRSPPSRCRRRARSTGRTPRSGRAIAKRSASSAAAANASDEDAAERHDLSDRVDALDAEEPGQGEHRCGDREQRDHQDPEQAKHDGDSMRAGCEIRQRRGRGASRRRATLGGCPASQRFEGPSDLHLHSVALRRHAAPGRGDGGRPPARAADGGADRPRHDVGVGRGGGCGGIARHDVRARHGAVGAPRVAERPRAGVPARSRRAGAACRDHAYPLVAAGSRAAHGRPDLPRLRRGVGRHPRADERRRDRRPPAHRRRPRGARASCAIARRRSPEY